MSERRKMHPLVAKLDMNRILPGLYQGAAPQRGGFPVSLKSIGFDSLVLAAEEYQPASAVFPGMRVMHAPLDDHTDPLSAAEWDTIVTAAAWVASDVRKGRRVLVTCWMGINRSGIIAALAVMMLTGWSGERTVAHVKKRRHGALRNPSFVKHILKAG